MFARDVMPMLVGTVYLLVGIGELAFYLGQSPAFWRFLARFRFAVAVEPWPGLTPEMLKGFERETPQSIVSYDSVSGALMARRAHGVGVRRMPAVVCVTLKPDPNGVLVPEARWGFVPFWGLLAFVLSGQALFLAMAFGGAAPVQVADVLWAVLMPMVPFGVASVVAFFLGRNAANAVLADLESEVMDLIRAS